MKTNQDVLPLRTQATELHNDSAKLVSLLALAAGAVAMPQTSVADIIYTDLGGSPATVGLGGGSDYLVNIPGTAVFKFQRRATTVKTNPGSLTINYKSVLAGDFGTPSTPVVLVQRNAQRFAIPKAFGATWDQGGGVMAGFHYVGTANDFNINGGKSPNTGYDHQYLAWSFENSTQGNATRYGWIEIGLQVNGYNAGGPLATVYRYGWDNTGAKPTMGQTPVPEPTAGAFTALAAMALGARGVRLWRQKCDAASVE